MGLGHSGKAGSVRKGRGERGQGGQRHLLWGTQGGTADFWAERRKLLLRKSRTFPGRWPLCVRHSPWSWERHTRHLGRGAPWPRRSAPTTPRAVGGGRAGSCWTAEPASLTPRPGAPGAAAASCPTGLDFVASSQEDLSSSGCL